MKTVRLAGSFPVRVRILLANQFGVNVGFYLLVPYLAVHLRDDLGFSLAAVGLVLGLRNFAQQGLFLLGGSASDRLGCRPVIITGCALRTVGFAMFALSESLLAVAAAAFATGLAGALFNPAVRAYLSLEAGERRAEAFSLFNVVANAGALVGPLLGSLLVATGFRAAAIVAAGIFAALTVAQALALPARPPGPATQRVGADWREALGNRRFVAFSVSLAGLFVLQTQLYLSLPLEGERATGTETMVAVLFGAATIANLGGQVRITAWCRRRWNPARAVTAGLAVTGVAFLPLLVLGAVGTASPATSGLGAAQGLAALPVVASTLLLSLGVMMAQPFAMELIAYLGRASLVGTYFGVFYLAAGIGAAVGNPAVGLAADVGERIGFPNLQWALLAGIGVASAAGIHRLDRRAPLSPEIVVPAAVVA